MGKKNISYRLSDLKNVMIPLGFMGENLYTRLIIDATEVYKDNPNAVVSLAVSPPRGDKYPAVVTRDGNNVIWDVSASDLIYDGNGEIQFTFTDSPMVRKSYKARISVNNSISPDGTVPTPIENFLTQASEALTACGEATTAAENAASKQPKIIEDYWYVWDAETEQYVTTGINAHGDAGHTPVITGDKTGKTSKIYSDGVQIAAIQDGEDGSPGDPTLIIDDTSTGLDKTWSASKQQELMSAFNSMTVQETLLRDDLPGTSKTVTFDSNNKPTSIVHSANGQTVRTDTFVWSENSVTETRATSSKYITIVTNLVTLAQTISAIEGVV